MNLSFNLTVLDAAQPGIKYFDPVAACANYGRMVGLWATLLLILSFAAILWFGPRGWLSRWVKNELARQVIGSALLVSIGILAALLQANLSR